jgi:hypothetical protein
VKEQIRLSETLSRKTDESDAVNNHNQIQLSNFKIELEQSASVKTDLKKQLKAKEEVLQFKNEETELLQTTVDILTDKLGSVNQVVQELCGQIKDVSSCKLEAVPVPSLQYLRQTGTSNSGQTETFRLKVPCPTSGSRL